MGFYLTLSLHHKAQAHVVTTQPGRAVTNGKGSSVPKRVEQAGAPAKLVQALFAPSQVVSFFATRVGQVLTQTLVMCSQGLRGVKRLSTYLAHVVHTHQRGGLGLLAFSQWSGCWHFGRPHGGGAIGVVAGKQRAQGAVSGGE